MVPEVAEIFSKTTGKNVAADIGLTGANTGVAATGAICIETNEGSGRLVSSIGNCHICVVGMEKIVESKTQSL